MGIVESLRRGEPLVELTGARPLVLTIEMGIEKLRRDYSHALLATGIHRRPAPRPHHRDGDREAEEGLQPRPPCHRYS